MPNTLSYSPLSLIFLEFFKYSNQRFSFLITKDMHYVWHMLYDTEFDFIAFIFKESIYNFEEIFLCFLLANNFCNLMKTLTESNFYFLRLVNKLLYHSISRVFNKLWIGLFTIYLIQEHLKLQGSYMHNYKWFIFIFLKKLRLVQPFYKIQGSTCHLS